MKIITIGTNPKDTYRNKVVRGIQFHMAAVSSKTDGTPLVDSDFDWSQISVKATLYRGGQQIIIAQDNLLWLLMGSNYYNPNFLTGKNPVSVGSIVRVAAAAGAAEQRTIGFSIDFGNVIHIHGADYMDVEVNCPTTAFSANVNVTTSNILMDSKLGRGHEYATPILKCRVLQAAEQNQSVDMGDDVAEVVFVNLDKSDSLDASAVINNISFVNNSNHAPLLTYQMLLAKRNPQFPTAAEGALRNQSFSLYENDTHLLEGSTLELVLNGANVNASKNFVFYRSYLHDANTHTTAHNHAQAAHSHRLQKTYGKTAHRA